MIKRGLDMGGDIEKNNGVMEKELQKKVKSGRHAEVEVGLQDRPLKTQISHA